MQSYRALTWDHPRGYNALAAAAARLDPVRDGLSIVWDRQPLEGFESHPIADLCARYDLVVLDHPHVGEAVEADCLQPLETVFGVDRIAELDAATIGPCLSSYRYGGRHWALPLDAATQVMAARGDLLEGPSPQGWAEVVARSQQTGKVALSMAGPHAILSYLSLAAALGEPPAVDDPDLLVSPGTGREAFELLAELAARSPTSVKDKNPIGILGHMATHDDVELCPLIYGYVNYAAPVEGKAIRFTNAPRMTTGGQPGSTLGGTGISISRRCPVTPELIDHLLWLMGDEAQSGFIPSHDGQPSRRSAWADEAVNRRWGDFYRNTADTLEAAYVRPRHSGYIAFQTKASALLRDAFDIRRPAGAVVAELQTLYRASRPNGGER
ncbi:extracellular solute-binding protein [Mesorhizobium sp. L-8-3]|uniref:extracellular solute-binding protein n=1 Tax=Mesorhizobium sp. L-8-3 TaxID=2744522 RepID=UPI001925D2D4|nr:extracellular solute-binding protein [Mesorhizobium sp. L-8-3]BCH24535.1 membrane protein [Mesorhizobium sp. L-8-3]